ncbi:hypothetical protein QVM41_18305 [Pseudomonas shirazica]|uniref:hypothetical protein n=1 Tax=Pseudomonas shirazica TaxID=1940636 RepID=UPI0035267C0C
MTTHSDAYFARCLLANLQAHHSGFPVESVKGRRIGASSVRVIQLTHSGGHAQFPFPSKRLHAGATNVELYRSAYSLLCLEPTTAALTN